MYFKFNNVKIFSVLSVVPKNIFKLKKQEETENIKRIKKVIGVKSSYKIDKDKKISDLYIYSAEKILKQNKINKKKLKVIICVTQTPDYTMPSTSNIIHEKLGLNQECIAFDVNQGCSGYVYGLFVISSILTNIRDGYGILLSGDTISKTIPNNDLGNKLLFGDGVSATLLQNKKKNQSCFIIGSAGFGSKMLMIEGSGFNKSLKRPKFFMDGKEVFSFALRNVPKLINNLKKKFKIKDDYVSYYIFHQANKMMLDKIFEILKIPKTKRLYSIEKFGNTSSASIPITLCYSKHKNIKKCIIAGFGAGFSYGAAYLDFKNTIITKIYKV